MLCDGGHGYTELTLVIGKYVDIDVIQVLLA